MLLIIRDITSVLAFKINFNLGTTESLIIWLIGKIDKYMNRSINFD